MKCVSYFLFAYLLLLGQNSTCSDLRQYLIQSIEKTENACQSQNRINKKYLKKYQKLERRLFSKLCKQNHKLSDYLFSYGVNKYFFTNELSFSSLHNSGGFRVFKSLSEDARKASVKYLITKEDSLSVSDRKRLQRANNRNYELEHVMNEKHIIQEMLSGRSALLKKVLENDVIFRSDIVKYDKLNYYFAKESSALSDKLYNVSMYESEFLKSLDSNQSFNDYFNLHGQLKPISKIPDDWGKAVDGLETNQLAKEKVNKTIDANGGVDKVLLNQVMPAKEGLKKLKNDFELNQFINIPDYLNDSNGERSDKNRIRYGLNFSIIERKAYIPSKFLIEGSVGYNLLPKLISGMGVSMNTGINDLPEIGKSQSFLQSTFIYFDYKIRPQIIAEVVFEKSLADYKSTNIIVNQRKSYFTSIWIGLKVKTRLSEKLYLSFSALYDLMPSSEHVADQIIYKYGFEN